MFGLSMFGTAGAGILGACALGGLLVFKYSYDSGIQAKAVNDIRDDQGKLNAVILRQAEEDDDFITELYTEYGVDVGVLLRTAAPPAQDLEQCPVDCSF